MNPNDLKVYEKTLSTLWIDKDGILYSVFKDVPRNLVRCTERTTFIKSLTKGKKICSIMDVSKSGVIDGEARKLLKKEFPGMYKALAIVSTSDLGKIIGTLTAVLAPASVPTQMFDDRSKAREWLKQYL